MTDQQLVFMAATRGGRYTVRAWRQPDGTYRARTYTRGREDGCMTGYQRDAMRVRLACLIVDARRYDRIDYRVVLNDLEVVCSE